jgi:hypothetical protein
LLPGGREESRGLSQTTGCDRPVKPCGGEHDEDEFGFRSSAELDRSKDWAARFRSVVEDVPADGAPALLIVENEFTDSGREVYPLPLPFLGPSLRSVVGWDACAGRPDGVRRSAQVMGGDVSHRNRLAR